MQRHAAKCPIALALALAAVPLATAWAQPAQPGSPISVTGKAPTDELPAAPDTAAPVASAEPAASAEPVASAEPSMPAAPTTTAPSATAKAPVNAAGIPLLWAPCGPPGTPGALTWCWQDPARRYQQAPLGARRPLTFSSEAELPPDDEGQYEPGESSSPYDHYRRMEKAGTILSLVGLGAAALGGLLLGAGLASNDPSNFFPTSTILTGFGGALLGAGGLSIVVGVPLAIAGSSGLPGD